MRNKQLNKPFGIQAGLYWAKLPTNRQRDSMVLQAEELIYQDYLYLFGNRQSEKRVRRRRIAQRIAFLYYSKGTDYTKTILYRVMVKLANDGFVWISWKNSGHPKPNTAYFFVKRTIRKTIEPIKAAQVSFWEGEAILHERRKYE